MLLIQGFQVTSSKKKQSTCETPCGDAYSISEKATTKQAERHPP